MDIINSLWNLHQEQRINETEGRAITADYSSKRSEHTTEDFKLQYDRMILIVSAFGELMIDKGILSNDELAKKNIEIDERDGKNDGRKMGKPIICDQCGSGVVKKFKKCLICGKEYPHISELDAL